MANRASYGWGRPTRSRARFPTPPRPVPRACRWWTSSRRFAGTGRTSPPSSPSPDDGPELEEAPILPAVDRQGRSGDKAGRVAGQEDHRGRQLIRPSVAAERDVADAARRVLGWVNTERDRLVAVLLPDAIGLEAPREDRIHPNLGGGLLGEGFAHRDHRRTQGVGEHEIVDGLVRRDRGEVDDGTSLKPQGRQGGARQANGAHQHQVEGLDPRLVVELRDGAEDGPAGVVDEHLEPTQRANRPRDQVATLVRLPDIGDPRYHVMALVAERPGCGLNAWSVAGGDNHPAAFRGERSSRGEPETTAGGGHQRPTPAKAGFHAQILGGRQDVYAAMRGCLPQAG